MGTSFRGNGSGLQVRFGAGSRLAQLLGCGEYKNERVFTVDAITVQLKASIIKNKIDSAAGLLSKRLHMVPETVHIITENILLRGS